MTIKEGTVEAIIACGNLDYRWRNAFYCIKDNILREQGQFVGLDHQQWWDKDTPLGSDDEETLEEYAVHNHILMRYLIGSVFFHIPTDEFYYRNYNMNATKKSAHYDEMIELCTVDIQGKKKRLYDRESQETAWRALKWLIREYDSNLHSLRRLT